MGAGHQPAAGPLLGLTSDLLGLMNDEPGSSSTPPGPADLLAEAVWECAPSAPGGPSPFADDAAEVFPAVVPGTAAAAMVAAGRDISGRDFDAEDWWYRCRFVVPEAGEGHLRLDGLATLADVWLNDELVLHSDNMFLARTVAVAVPAGECELVIRFAALEPELRVRRPRPRWKVARLRSQQLRWIRTSLLGRLIGGPAVPAPVGPWRAVRLSMTPAPQVRWLRTDVTEGQCFLEVGIAAPEVTSGVAEPVSVSMAGQRFELTDAGDGVHSGRFVVPGAELWWPHTHGAQPLYEVTLQRNGEEIPLGAVGFRSVTVDRTDGAFEIAVNGVPVFGRGAIWTPLDPVGLTEDPAALREALLQFRSGSMNLLRISGETVYPGPVLLSLCDEFGLLVWQDCMFAFADLPDQPEFLASVESELREQFAELARHPSLAVVSGGSEIEQQATYFGVPTGGQLGQVHTALLPRVMAELLPDITFVTSSPSGGVLPTDPRTGISHYYGVGAYLRPLDDARRAGVRFAAECLAFANPPERRTVDENCGGAARFGHHPEWKAAVYRDAGASWDFEDVREHYVRELFGAHTAALRFSDPERALDLGRAAVAELFTSTLSEWRRPGSTCRGALVYHHHDALPGAGLGIVDALGRPKSAWYALRRTMAPVAVVVTDEGLNGIDAHLLNERAEDVAGTLRVELFTGGEVLAEVAERELRLAGRGNQTVPISGMFSGFRDVNHAHHFGPLAYDVIAVSLLDSRGALLSQSVHLPGGVDRPVEPDLGLTALVAESDGHWQVTVSTRRFAQWVQIDCAPYLPEDSWFHLPPGESRTVPLRRTGSADATPTGSVRAFNGADGTRVLPEPDHSLEPSDSQPTPTGNGEQCS